MTEYQEASIRTLKPIIGGSLIGLFLYFVFKYISLPVIGVGAAFVLLIWYTAFVYRMNLDSVRREREDSETENYSK